MAAMDPVGAFRLAGTVIQFIDSASRFALLAHRLHQSGKNTDDDQSDLIKITDSLDAILPALKKASDNSETEQSLGQLAQDCAKSAGQLLSILQQVKPTGNSRKRDALKVAFRLVFKQEEIKLLNDRLSSFRGQLNLHLLVSIREHVTKSAEQQAEGLKKLGAVENETAKIGGVAASILQHLVSKQPGGQIQNMISLREDLVNTINESRENGKDAHGFRPASIQLSPSDYRQALAWFLHRLRYENMIDRENRIVTPHESTFRWVFKDELSENQARIAKWSSLKEWLESNNQLYWITGKAGSGKSTLMKFLSYPTPQYATAQNLDDMGDDTAIEKSQCEPYLRKWAGDQPLIIASFYFWNSGVNLQMTQVGLLRTLLSQIVAQRPDILPILAPKEWEAFCLFDHYAENWTMQDLQRMFCAAVKILRTDSKLCFFIDGLDEFDGSHQELIDLVRNLVEGDGNVKICVASRPWNVFQDEFGKKPSLKLEDLTFDDIKNFVQSKLGGDSEFANMQLRYPSFANELIEKIVIKASGVFLWVDLVVESLLAGMRLGDRIEDFQQRLDDLPPNLEKLYEKILYSLDKFYLRHAAQCFALVETAEAPLTILQFSFADEESPISALDMNIGALSHADISLRAQAVSRRLNSRCKGLLEVERGLQAGNMDRPWQLTIQYLHRTVRDFIKSPKAQSFLQLSGNANFDPSLQLCLSYLMEMKAWLGWKDNVTVSSNDAAFSPSIHGLVQCLRRAANVRNENETVIVGLLKELKRLVSREDYMKHIANDPRLRQAGYYVPKARRFELQYDATSFHYLRNLTALNGSDELISKSWNIWTATTIEGAFMSLACLHGVAPYVRARATRGGFGFRLTLILDEWPLLLDSLSSDVPDPRVVACLLDAGADPNFRSTKANIPTPWTVAISKVSLLHIIQESSTAEDYSRAERKWKETLKLMFIRGGNKAKVPEHLMSPIASKMIREIRDELGSSQQQKLVNLSTWFGMTN